MSAETLSAISTFMHSLWAERWDLFIITISVIYRNEIMHAIKGGNGHLQIDELMKGLIMMVFYMSVRAEMDRHDLTHSVFSDTYWFATLGAVAIIGRLKGFVEMFGKKNTVKDNP